MSLGRSTTSVSYLVTKLLPTNISRIAIVAVVVAATSGCASNSPVGEKSPSDEESSSQSAVSRILESDERFYKDGYGVGSFVDLCDSAKESIGKRFEVSGKPVHSDIGCEIQAQVGDSSNAVFTVMTDDVRPPRLRKIAERVAEDGVDASECDIAEIAGPLSLNGFTLDSESKNEEQDHYCAYTAEDGHAHQRAGAVFERKKLVVFSVSYRGERELSDIIDNSWFSEQMVELRELVK